MIGNIAGQAAYFMRNLQSAIRSNSAGDYAWPLALARIDPKLPHGYGQPLIGQYPHQTRWTGGTAADA
jgi:hypothetical protein